MTRILIGLSVLSSLVVGFSCIAKVIGCSPAELGLIIVTGGIVLFGIGLFAWMVGDVVLDKVSK